ncbi:hypothetical protein KM043_002853 [Ampulex compressa]|nr:hypothetical protein KM043_002853 [Ampulex compressa]
MRGEPNSSSGMLYGQKLDECPSKLESSKERFPSYVEPVALTWSAMAKSERALTASYQVRRTADLIAQRTPIKALDNRAAKARFSVNLKLRGNCPEPILQGDISRSWNLEVKRLIPKQRGDINKKVPYAHLGAS